LLLHNSQKNEILTYWILFTIVQISYPTINMYAFTPANDHIPSRGNFPTGSSNPRKTKSDVVSDNILAMSVAQPTPNPMTNMSSSKSTNGRKPSGKSFLSDKPTPRLFPSSVVVKTTQRQSRASPAPAPVSTPVSAHVSAPVSAHVSALDVPREEQVRARQKKNKRGTTFDSDGYQTPAKTARVPSAQNAPNAPTRRRVANKGRNTFDVNSSVVRNLFDDADSKVDATVAEMQMATKPQQHNTTGRCVRAEGVVESKGTDVIDAVRPAVGTKPEPVVFAEPPSRLSEEKNIQMKTNAEIVAKSLKDVCSDPGRIDNRLREVRKSGWVPAKCFDTDDFSNRRFQTLGSCNNLPMALVRALVKTISKHVDAVNSETFGVNKVFSIVNDSGVLGMLCADDVKRITDSKNVDSLLQTLQGVVTNLNVEIAGCEKAFRSVQSTKQMEIYTQIVALGKVRDTLRTLVGTISQIEHDDSLSPEQQRVVSAIKYTIDLFRSNDPELTIEANEYYGMLLKIVNPSAYVQMMQDLVKRENAKKQQDERRKRREAILDAYKKVFRLSRWNALNAWAYIAHEMRFIQLTRGQVNELESVPKFVTDIVRNLPFFPDYIHMFFRTVVNDVIKNEDKNSPVGKALAKLRAGVDIPRTLSKYATVAKIVIWFEANEQTLLGNCNHAKTAEKTRRQEENTKQKEYVPDVITPTVDLGRGFADAAAKVVDNSPSLEEVTHLRAYEKSLQTDLRERYYFVVLSPDFCARHCDSPNVYDENGRNIAALREAKAWQAEEMKSPTFRPIGTPCEMLVLGKLTEPEIQPQSYDEPRDWEL
jgi:hypothetical protein